MSDVGRESSMEDILASIRRVIADDPKPAPRGARPWTDADEPSDDDVLELDASLMQLPPPADGSLVSPGAIEATRNSLAALSALKAGPAGVPPSAEGPLEAVIRDMLRPMLKEWLDQRLPGIVDEIVAKEVARITGRS